METTTIGEKIRLARRGAGLTQEDLGRKIGFSQVQVSSYERGDVTGINLEVITLIARATHRPLSFFVPGAPKSEMTLAEILHQRYPDIEDGTIREIESFAEWAVYRDRQARSAGTGDAGETSRADSGDTGQT